MSPDTIVRDAGMVIDYNRFLYVRGSPLGYTDPTGRDPLGQDWVEEFTRKHGRALSDEYRLARLVSLTRPGPISGSQSWTEEDWANFSEAQATLSQGGNKGVSQRKSSWQTYLRQRTANVVQWLIPPGVVGTGVTASTGVILDITGDAGVYLEDSGDLYIGLSLGFGGTTGANVDVGYFVQYFPWASGVGVMEDWTVNAGVSAVLGPPILLVFAGVGGHPRIECCRRSGYIRFYARIYRCGLR